jgi:hypothetical protein
MYPKNSRIAPLLACLSLFTGMLAWSDPAPTAAQQYRPPKVGTPKRRVGAGTRGPCLTGKRSLMPLVPEDTYGATVSQQPTFFWYIPPKSMDAAPNAAKSAEFRLLDRQGNDTEVEIYKSTIPLSGFSGIVSYTLPTSVQLDEGKEYIWQFSVVCSEDSPSNNPFVEGVVQRIEPAQPLNTRIQVSPARDRPSIYASAGIWYDSLTSLANLRCTNPSDVTLTMGWSSLLRSVQLDEIVGEPLSQYCAQVGASQLPPRAGFNQAVPRLQAEPNQ